MVSGPHAEAAQTAPGLSVLHRAVTPEKNRVYRLRVAWPLPKKKDRPVSQQPLRPRVARQRCPLFAALTHRPSRRIPVNRLFTARRAMLALAQGCTGLIFGKTCIQPLSAEFRIAA